MLSNSTPKTKVGSSAVCYQAKSQVRLVKGRKPLLNHKFYLDIKNHVVTSKIETKIKELGGVIELFLIREVTHIVSDRPILAEENSKTPYNSAKGASTPQTSRTPGTASNFSNDSTTSAVESPFTPSESHRTPIVKKTHKSRADAMLERARLQTTNVPIDPIHNARLWGIPIWSVEKVLNWLDKVSASILLPNEELSVLKNRSKLKSTVNVTELKAPFIKFEPITRDARPVYQQLTNWPRINLNIDVGESPFVTRKSTTSIQCVGNLNKMLRKTRTRLSLRTRLEDTTPVHQHGYCEICRVEYDDLTVHVRTETHLNFVRDDSNFLSLDSLITAGANVEAFLRLNGSTKDLSSAPYPVFSRRSMRRSAIKTQIEVKINGDAFSPPRKCSSPDKNVNVTARMTRSSSACEKTTKEITPAPVSPALSDSGHHLRSRGQLWLPSNLLGTTAEDDGNPIKPSPKEPVKRDRETRSSCREKEIALSIKNEPFLDEDSDDEQPLSKHINKNNVQNLKTEVSELPNNIKSSGTIRRNSGNKVKRPSADIKPVTENKAYYKVEVLSSKLRSSATTQRDIELQARVHTPIAEEDELIANGDDNEPSPNDRLVVKFKRVRRSELSVLSNEAENFMFPRRDETSSDECDTDEDRNTTHSTARADSIEIKSSEPDSRLINKENSDIVTDEGSQDCVSAISSCDSDINNSCVSNRKKRRTHAELFISDNEKYYKFETPGSRLRFQGSFLPLMAVNHSTPTNKHETSGKVKTEDTDANVKSELDIETNQYTTLPPLDKLNYSFERVEKMRTVFANDLQVERDFLLFVQSQCPRQIPMMPYEMNTPLTPIDSQICKESFEKRLRPIEECQSGGGDVASETNHSEVNSIADSYDDQASSDSKQSHEKVSGRKRTKRYENVEQSKNPRKSPRQHASTLAILSGLLQQRRRKSKLDGELSDTPNLTPIPEQNEESTPVCQSPVNEHTDTRDDYCLNLELPDDYSNFLPDIDERLFGIDEDEAVVSDGKTDFVRIMETYHQSQVMEIASRERRCRRSPNKRRRVPDNSSLFSPKGVRRKNRRKNNRTGWPKKRRYLMRRGEVGDRTDIGTAEQFDDSVEENCEDRLSLDECSSNTSGEQGKQIEVENLGICKETLEKDTNKVFDYLKNSNKTAMEFSDDSKDCRNNFESLENKENTSRAGTSQSPIAERELDFISTPSRNGSRNPSSDCLGFSAEERVEAEKWESVDNILNAKLTESLNALKADVEACNERRASIDFQPLVMIEKIDSPSTSIGSASHVNHRRLRSSSSPARSAQPKPKRVKTSTTASPPVSPRKLRKPRGRWYRDR